MDAKRRIDAAVCKHCDKDMLGQRSSDQVSIHDDPVCATAATMQHHLRGRVHAMLQHKRPNNPQEVLPPTLVEYAADLLRAT
eukprot:CAMPEP_0115533992 /NCGR_PEP_ID=MMETSP0271-20121206/86427_1 /TAXON_ID=71861 /ORGANISM="Scrippsiella trochoidea, Strain CCMP3099" /LENGTH=81 /DNA_ID=CAMNT_0002966431 /DNA_START=73 /DNA_END=315 /DNA_ORIENTATION=+